VPVHQLPRSEATIATVASVAAAIDMHFVSAVLERWRGATSQRDVPNDPALTIGQPHAQWKRRCCSHRWVSIPTAFRC